jgi:hypothetical protein
MSIEVFDFAVVEGNLEVSIVSSLLAALDIAVPRIIVKRGRDRFWRDAPRLNQAARAMRILGLTDLDQYPCPSALLGERLKAGRSPGFELRIASRAIESWLLGDRQAIAQAFGVSIARVPRSPDEESNPKLSIVNIARHAKFRAVRDALVPNDKSKALVGSEYLTWMRRYAVNHWRPLLAAESSPSLGRAIRRIRQRAGLAEA